MGAHEKLYSGLSSIAPPAVLGFDTYLSISF
jgi:hypothetical protein